MPDSWEEWEAWLVSPAWGAWLVLPISWVRVLPAWPGVSWAPATSWEPEVPAKGLGEAKAREDLEDRPMQLLLPEVVEWPIKI